MQDLTEFKQSQTGVLDVFLAIVTVMLVIAIIIAILGIVNTLLLSVYERTREIGLLRAVGMERKQVRKTVRWESVIFSLQGTIIGTAVMIGLGLFDIAGFSVPKEWKEALGLYKEPATVGDKSIADRAQEFLDRGDFALHCLRPRRRGLRPLEDGQHQTS